MGGSKGRGHPGESGEGILVAGDYGIAAWRGVKYPSKSDKDVAVGARASLQ